MRAAPCLSAGPSRDGPARWKHLSATPICDPLTGATSFYATDPPSTQRTHILLHKDRNTKKTTTTTTKKKKKKRRPNQHNQPSKQPHHHPLLDTGYRSTTPRGRAEYTLPRETGRHPTIHPFLALHNTTRHNTHNTIMSTTTPTRSSTHTNNTIRNRRNPILAGSYKFPGHQGSVTCLESYSYHYEDENDNQTNNNNNKVLIVSGSDDGTVRLWEISTNQNNNTNKNHRVVRATTCLRLRSLSLSSQKPPWIITALTVIPSSSLSSSSSVSLFARPVTVLLASWCGSGSHDDNHNDNHNHDNNDTPTAVACIVGQDLSHATGPLVTVPVPEIPFGVWSSNNNNAKEPSPHEQSPHHTATPSSSFSSVPVATDEINQLAVLPLSQTPQLFHSGSSSDPPSQSQRFLVASADDAGLLHLYGCQRTTERNPDDDQHHSEQEEPPPHPSPVPLSFQRLARWYHDPDEQELAESTTLVTCAAFRPHPNQHNDTKKDGPIWLATGGTDCTVSLWNVTAHVHAWWCNNHQTHHDSSQHTTTSTLPQPQQYVMATIVSDESISQVCNPPLVHCLHWNNTGQYLAVGLGDGSVALLEFVESSTTPPNHQDDDDNDDDDHDCLQLMGRWQQAHAGSIVRVVFAPSPPRPRSWHFGSSFEPFTTRRNVEDEGFFLWTTGNDGTIQAWNLAPWIVQQQQQQDDDNDDEEEATPPPPLVCFIDHASQQQLQPQEAHKPNDLVVLPLASPPDDDDKNDKNKKDPTTLDGPSPSYLIVVADTSHEMTGYHICFPTMDRHDDTKIT